MNERMQALKRAMYSLNIEGMIVTNQINIEYLTNIKAEGILLIKEKENIYLTDSRYIEEVQNTLKLSDEIGVEDRKNLVYDDYENIFIFCTNVGFEENDVTYAGYKEIMQKYRVNNLVETEGIIEKLRMVKDANEIENIQKACKITDECYEYILEYIKPGMTEKQIADEIETYYKVNAEGLAFDTIVASGENSSKPHATPTNRKIQEIDIITIDMGCVVNGYTSDMTRTFFVGKVEPEKEKIYELVLSIQQNIGRMIRSGESVRNISLETQNIYDLNKVQLMHSVGHGVGRQTHELPYIAMGSDMQLRENSVITNEPGIYLPGEFGVRIEDTLLVTKLTNTVFTKSSKKCKVICIK